MSPTSTLTRQQVEALRRFNRGYTQKIGVLDEGYLASPFSLTEGRILYELAHGQGRRASALRTNLAIDAGYVSRILKSFERKGLIRRRRSSSDGRRSDISLTATGRSAVNGLDRASDVQVRELLAPLSVDRRERLFEGMNAMAEALELTPPQSSALAYTLRPHRIGDMGWVVARQALVYAEEFGWNEEYEALVAEITAKFLRDFDARKERCWIAERRGAIAGSIFLVKLSKTVAKLRLLYVDPSARGLGIGQALVDECVTAARQLGYRELRLWTQSILSSARRIYESRGFTKVSEDKHRSFGKDLIAQTWSLDLRTRR